MTFFYNLGIRLYYLLVWLASFYNSKAKLWIKGRQNLFNRLQNEIKHDKPIAWFHAASLGEFEQGRPIIEALKKERSAFKIVLTFFSPSGYEIRKNYPGADHIFYLPLDTRRNAKKFLEIVNPTLTIFVKYEYWHHFLTQLRHHPSKVLLISAIFRHGQVFFKPYGSWYRKLLSCFDHLFVQDENSAQLLTSVGINNVTVTGDTRFDRVAQIVAEASHIPVAQEFSNKKFTFIFGSTWEKDEDLLVRYINEDKNDNRFIIAPHEIHEAHLKNLTSKLKCSYLFFSEAADHNDLNKKKVLIINNIGMLSSLYRYGKVAYIGGGFGIGIHNILEAAVYGLPVVFGPNYRKFREAHELIAVGGAFPVTSYETLKLKFDQFREDKVLMENTSAATHKFVKKNLGATTTILDYLKKDLWPGLA